MSPFANLSTSTAQPGAQAFGTSLFASAGSSQFGRSQGTSTTSTNATPFPDSSAKSNFLSGTGGGFGGTRSLFGQPSANNGGESSASFGFGSGSGTRNSFGTSNGSGAPFGQSGTPSFNNNNDGKHSSPKPPKAKSFKNG
ncbi:uncharacterized protein N7496_005436 [Penicillium cataractarum]|uniref:Uncharacterized protein n=1 Tax=Penicillium cataractarum TaxID=2100454 RepID=A0A9W9VDJ2_9EURO|nr:uncharacterized protein N7496_005436 [Penicillium cataractarum]KAJ5378027.1 hypothetical protein N7496_005436 [Penicillium cataractarum]